MYVSTHTHTQFLYVCEYTHTHMCVHTHTHTHTLEYYLAIKKERKNAIYSTMTESRDYTKRSGSDRERQISCDLIYLWNVKNYKTETDSQKRNYGYQRGQVWGRDNLEVWD